MENRYMQNKLSVFILFLIIVSQVYCQAPVSAKWIWQSGDGPSNSWVCFRKNINLNEISGNEFIKIAVDSKYWLWINGVMVVREGELKRGPTPTATYCDSVNVGPYLTKGSNTVAVLVWFWGRDGYSHKNSGKGGLFIKPMSQNFPLFTDQTWKTIAHPGFIGSPVDTNSYRLSEFNIQFDARKDIENWFLPDFDDSKWLNATEKGDEGGLPWGILWNRPIPQWKNSGLLDYTNSASLPKTSTDSVTVKARLPYNAQVTPYLKINSSAGMKIEIKSDNFIEGQQGLRCTYITRDGNQEFEMPAWINGHFILYTLPAGINSIEFKYRESGYNCSISGSYTCNDYLLEKLWEKAARTLYVNMRDNFMDCPDRERAQYWGDVTTDIGQCFYALDTNSYALIRKAISNLIEWKKPSNILYSPVPSGSWNQELPLQSLTAVGWYGFWMYYQYTGDQEMIKYVYPHIRDYLAIWTMGADGLIQHRTGDWDWTDWGSGIDVPVIENCWYYLALKAAREMAKLTNENQDTVLYTLRMHSIEENFNKAFWKNDGYHSSSASVIDDRANGMAVIAGFADSLKWPAILKVLNNTMNASPYMEKYVLEAMFKMNAASDALTRMKIRYTVLITDTLYSTLPEGWYYSNSAFNHAWSGGVLTLLSSLTAGIIPETPGFSTFGVFPVMGSLEKVNCSVQTVKGTISVSNQKREGSFSMDLHSPQGTRALIGIPKDAGISLDTVCVNGKIVWLKGDYIGGVEGITFVSVDNKYLVFSADPGDWTIKTGVNKNQSSNLARSAIINASSSVEDSYWGVNNLIDGLTTENGGVIGYSAAYAHPSADYNEWIELDFGKEVSFSQVRLFPIMSTTSSGSAADGFPQNFTIDVSSDNQNFKTVLSVSNESVSNGLSKTYNFDIQQARYLRLSVTKLGVTNVNGGNPTMYRLRLSELEVYSQDSMPIQGEKINKKENEYGIINRYNKNIIIKNNTGNIGKFEIFNMAGKLVSSYYIDKSSTSINIDKLCPFGTYLIRLRFSDRNITQKIIHY